MTIRKLKILPYIACFLDNENSLFFLVGSQLKEGDIYFPFDVVHIFEGRKAFSNSVHAFFLHHSLFWNSLILHCHFLSETELISPCSCLFWSLLNNR